MPGKSRPRFIVFEGLDGAGKSACARRTAKLLNGEYMTTPSDELRAYRNAIISDFGSCQEASQYFYFATVLAASAEARSHIENGRSVVLDRYFLSTQVYAKFRGSQLSADEALINFLLPADITVFLDVPLNIRQKRLEERGANAADLETLTPEADTYLRQTYQRMARLPVVGDWLPVNVESHSIDEIAQCVASLSGH